ncbi:DUF2171 domain-containing protein [Deinococcus peraridilitoris]|uniref:DUF2171 domain-containing protein n=1 Tax=Deinococcus peraridilitoris (strain DSM 19664 / LMG 22246 / CIP 109416 / KR-200) TaxID=937777 RepID=L0A4G2_DEIPD|nr:DUF2171 domain-containing protein [Deinococcus peraridilitoris]AFZ67915.1 hypothetical protein Deipe_2443 [Deinococcus peraridilitoris DSM 19664]
MNPSDIHEHMMVHARGEGSMMGAPGVHVGTIDGVDGNFLKLTKNDSPNHEHRWIPISWVDHIDERAVYLNRTADEFQQGAMTSDPNDHTGQAALSGTPSGMSGSEALGSAGGSIISDRDLEVSGQESPMGDRSTTLGGHPNEGSTTDSYTASGVGNTMADQELMSGAGAASGQTGDRNANTGAQGNVSSEDGLPGQGQDTSSGSFAQTQGSAQDQAQVQGMQGYDTSYSGGSNAMPGEGGLVGGSAATPSSTMNTNLDPALAGTDFDQQAMGQAVDERQNDAPDSEGDPNRPE